MFAGRSLIPAHANCGLVDGASDESGRYFWVAEEVRDRVVLILGLERVLELDVHLNVEGDGFCCADHEGFLWIVDLPRARQELACEEFVPASKTIAVIVWIWNTVCVQEILETGAGEN